MKATGVVRCIDELGRIVVPKEIRRKLDINDDDQIEIFVENEKIILQKFVPCCMFCGNAETKALFHGKKICEGCLAELKSLS